MQNYKLFEYCKNISEKKYQISHYLTYIYSNSHKNRTQPYKIYLFSHLETLFNYNLAKKFFRGNKKRTTPADDVGRGCLVGTIGIEPMTSAM